jgi:hypothetical protein
MFFSEEECQHYKEILELYCLATGMETNITKSALYFPEVEAQVRNNLEHTFPFPSHDLNDGIKYLGYSLKPNNYGKVDWMWLLSRIEKRVNFWCNHWISRGGRLVLIKSILEAIPVYWHLLAHIPKGILDRIKKVCFNYLWKGNCDYKGSHLKTGR